MDPLSIAAGAVALIHASAVVTNSLRRLNQALRTAETRIGDLCDELTNLTALLEAVENSLKGCSSLDFASMDEALWRQSETVMADCRATLSELGVLVDKINEGTDVRGLGWRARIAMDLNVHRHEITALQDKIYKSTSALRTVLHTITVSLSLRNNASQEVILFELSQLKSSIADAMRASLTQPRDSGVPLNSSSRVGNNLRSLAEAASQFHSAASSTASTIRSGSTASPPRTYSHAPASLNGVFPEYKRERVETYISEAQRQAFPVERVTSPQPVSVTPPRHASPSCLPPLAIPAFGNTVLDYEEEDELEFEKMYLEGLEDLAKDSIRTGDFDQAVTFLEKAMESGRRPEIREDSGRLNVQLAICHLFQGDWRCAESIVLDLAKLPRTADMVTCTMLHAISLAYLKCYSFDRALELCKQAVGGKRRYLKSRGSPWQNDSDYAESLGLLATILEMMGDFVSAEIYRRRMPPGYVYKHPADRFEFIASHRPLLQSVLGADLPDLRQPSSPGDGSQGGLFELDANIPLYQHQREGASWESNAYMSSLRAKRYEWQRAECDTGKEVVVHDADSAICMEESDSSKTSSPVSPVSPLKRRLSRMFGSRRGGRQREAPSPVDPVDDKTKEVSPITRWFKDRNVFGLKKSRSFRRAHDKALLEHFGDPHNQKTFRLMRMKRMSLEDMYDPACSHEPRGYSGLNGSEMSSNFFTMPRVPEVANDVGEPSVRATAPQNICRSDSIQDTPVDISNDRPLSQSHPPEPCAGTVAELPADSDPSYSTPEQRRQEDMDKAVVFVHMYSLFHPNRSGQEEGHMSFLAMPDWTDIAITPEQVLVATKADSLPDTPQHAQTTPSDAHPQHHNRQELVSSETTRQNVIPLLESLASILTLLPSLDSPASRHVARMKLKSIVSRLQPVTSDMQIVYDVQQVISRLEDDGSATTKRKGNPSSDRPEEEDMPTPKDITSREKTKSAPPGMCNGPLGSSPDEKGDGKPALRRAFSWVAEPSVLCSPHCRSDSGGGGVDWRFLGCSCRGHAEYCRDMPEEMANREMIKPEPGQL